MGTKSRIIDEGGKDSQDKDKEGLGSSDNMKLDFSHLINDNKNS